MRKTLCSMFLCAAIGAGGAAAEDEETLLEYVLDNCSEDIESFCDDVTPGGGRVAMCLAAYEDQISTGCTLALYDAATVLEAMTDEIVYLAESCAGDIDAFCADTVPGEGRLLQCLANEEAELSESCDEALEDLAEDDMGD